MNEQEIVVYSVYVGIDWANAKHDVCIQHANSDAREFDVIQHRAEAIDTWVKDLHRRLLMIAHMEPFEDRHKGAT